MDFSLANWNNKNFDEFISYLISIEDIDYKTFHSRLVPEYPTEKLIGIRLPVLRKIAKEIVKGNYNEFLKLCKNDYYEEIMIKGIVIGFAKFSSYNDFISAVDGYIDLVDNWAICDCFCNGLKQIKLYKLEYFNHISTYLNSENPWHIRVGIVIMLSHYLENDYIFEVLKRVDSISNNHYYVKMAQAWLIATAYAKFPDITHSYLLSSNLDNWTFNKAIQKACESFRIDKNTKILLRSMKKK